MGKYTSVEETVSSISREDVLKWIKKNGPEGCTQELKKLVAECSEFIDGVNDVIQKHMECAAFFHVGVSFGVHAVKDADDIDTVFESFAGPGARQVRDKFSTTSTKKKQGNKDSCNCGKFGGSCENDDCREAVSDMIDSLEPDAKMMLAMLAIMGAKE